MKLSLAVVVLLVIGSPLLAQAECGGCDKVESITEQLRTFKNTDDDKTRIMLEKASAAVLAMPQGKDHKLTSDQVHIVVKMLGQSEQIDSNQLVIEDLTPVIKANQKAFLYEIKLLPAKESSLVSKDVFVVIEELRHGND